MGSMNARHADTPATHPPYQEVNEQQQPKKAKTGLDSQRETTEETNSRNPTYPKFNNPHIVTGTITGNYLVMLSEDDSQINVGPQPIRVSQIANANVQVQAFSNLRNPTANVKLLRRHSTLVCRVHSTLHWWKVQGAKVFISCIS
ncbi:hypothetical protein BGZ76_009536 [Entomortierella beljakovae]|nr:hypothetical protein BGZ76_009536 [Entomortierella beljakovae]